MCVNNVKLKNKHEKLIIHRSFGMQAKKYWGILRRVLEDFEAKMHENMKLLALIFFDCVDFNIRMQSMVQF